MPSEQEIRDLVRRVLDDPGEQAASSSSPTSSPEPRPAAANPGQTVAVGADHGGWKLKERIAGFLQELGYQVRDCGTFGGDSVDYPDFAHEVAKLVADGSCHWGIVVDGAGIGSAMTANKVPGVRAALCYDLSTARNSREHNHANVLTLGAGLIGDGLALQIVQTWLETPWGPGRHARRIDKIREVEKRYLRGVGG
ncbi:MAG: ribose 5-phosphate isomerase B [Thermoanaerobaculia bacterium]